MKGVSSRDRETFHDAELTVDAVTKSLFRVQFVRQLLCSQRKRFSTIFKMDSTRSSRQGTTEEQVEENIGGDWKVEDEAEIASWRGIVMCLLTNSRVTKKNKKDQNRLSEIS